MVIGKKLSCMAAVMAAALVSLPESASAQREQRSKGASRMSSSRETPTRSATRSAPSSSRSYSPSPRMSAAPRSAPVQRSAPAMRSSRSAPSTASRMSSPRSVPVARSETYKSQPRIASRPSAGLRSEPSQRSFSGSNRNPSATATRDGYSSPTLSRTPLTRVAPESASQLTPRKSGPGDDTVRHAFGDRRWSGSDSRGGYGGDDVAAAEYELDLASAEALGFAEFAAQIAVHGNHGD